MAPLPLVSVCVAAFNAEPFFRHAITSILGQTYANLEVLILDDRSEDRTYEIARSFADDRLSVRRAERRLGGYQAMNRVIRLARGEFVAVYHADDVYDSAIVEKEVVHLRAHPEVGAVFTRDHNIDEEGRLIRTIALPRELAGRPALDFDTVLRYVVRRRNPFCCPTFMARRSVLEAVGPFDAARWDIAADLDMWLRIARRHALAIVDEPLVRYRKSRSRWTGRFHRLRTAPDPFFGIVDECLARDGARTRLTPADLVEYDFQRCDDDTFRAANCVIAGDLAAARALLRARSYPWRTLRAPGRRRKLRLLALRAFIAGGLAVGAARPLGRVLGRLGP